MKKPDRLRPGARHVDDEAKAGVPPECGDGARRPLLQIGERALEMKALIDKFSLAARIARRARRPLSRPGQAHWCRARRLGKGSMESWMSLPTQQPVDHASA